MVLDHSTFYQCFQCSSMVRFFSIMPETIERKRNWAPWLALLLAVAAVLSNAGFFVSIPGQGALVWVGLALAIAALVYAVMGVVRAFRQPQVYGGKVSSPILGFVSLLLCAFVAFAFFGARALPASAGAPKVGQKAPDFTLVDSSGAKVSLEQMLGKAPGTFQTAYTNSSTTADAARPPKAVLLVFYRGWW
jgi:hypothetical protein